MNYTEFMARVEDKLQESSGFPVAGMSVQEMERLCLEIGHRSFGGSLYCCLLYTSDHIHAFHGRALAVLRSDGNAGKCVLTVSAAGLPSAAAEVIFVTLR